MPPNKNATPKKRREQHACLRKSRLFCLAILDEKARGKPFCDVKTMSPYKGIVPADANSEEKKSFQDSWDYVSNNYSKSKKLQDKVAEILEDHDKALLEDDDDFVPDDDNLPSDDSKHAPPVPAAAASRRGGGNNNTNTNINTIADSGAIGGAGMAAHAGPGGALSLDGGTNLNARGSAVPASNGRKGRGRKEYGQRRKKIKCSKCGTPITNNKGTLAKHDEACSRKSSGSVPPAPAAAPVPPAPAPPVPAPAPAATSAASSARGNNIGGVGFAAAAKPAADVEEDDDNDDVLGALPADDDSIDTAIAPAGRDWNGPMSTRAIASAVASLSPEAGGVGLGAIGGGGGGSGVVDAAEDSPEYEMNALGLVYDGRLVNTSKPYTLTLGDGKSKIMVQWLLDHRKFVLLPDADAGRDKPVELTLASRDSPPPPFWYLLHEDSGIMAKLPGGVVTQTIELPSVAPRARTPAAGISASATAPSTPKDSHRKKSSAFTFASEDRSICHRGSSRSIGTGQLKDDRNYASDEEDDRSNAGPAPVHFTFSPTTVSASRPRLSCSPGDGFGVGTGLPIDDYAGPKPSPARSSRKF